MSEHRPPPPDEKVGSLHRGLTSDRAVRFLAVEARALSDHIRQIHGLSGDAVRLAAELVVANALMSAWIKGNERITLQMQGQRPRFSFAADVDAEGGVRARFTPGVLPPQGGVDGLLMAIKADAQRELYRGMTELRSESVEQALAKHLGQSDQVDVLVRIEAEVDEEGALRSAAGLVLERLPEERDQPSITNQEFLDQHGSVREQNVADLMVALAFGKISNKSIDLLESRPLHWRCGCSQQRIEAVLFNLGEEQLTQLLHEDGRAEVVCHFCAIPYEVGGPRLAELVALHRGAAAPEERP